MCISLFLFSLCQGCGSARYFFTASSDRLIHPPLSLVFFFQSSSSPPFLTFLLPQSSHLSLGLLRLLLHCSRNSAALFGSLSSAILSTCPAHRNLLLTSPSVKLLCTPVSSLNSTILRLSALVTLAIFRTQLLHNNAYSSLKHNRMDYFSEDNKIHNKTALKFAFVSMFRCGSSLRRSYFTHVCWGNKSQNNTNGYIARSMRNTQKRDILTEKQEGPRKV